MTRCGCGTWPPAGRSGSPSPATAATSARWRSARTARPWPAAASGRRHGAAVGRGHRPPDRAPPHRPHRRRRGRWRSARTARPWPAAATMARCGCGTWPPAARSAPRSPATPTVSVGGVQPGRQDPGQRQRRWHGAAVGRGHRPADRQPAHRPQPTGPARWRSARTARPWPAAAPMARCGCGTWPPAADRAAPSPATPRGRLGGVQPGRQDPGQRQRRWHGAAVGRGHRPPDRQPPHRPHRRGLLGGVQPGRQDPGQRQRGWHGAAVGRGHRPADRAPPHRPHRHVSLGGVQPGRQDPGQRQRPMARCGCGTWPPAGRSGTRSTGHTELGHLGGVQPGRQDPGQRQRRRHGAAVGRGHRPARSAAPSPATPARSSRWRSARTARPWPAAATMARCGCGTWPPAGRSAAR